MQSTNQKIVIVGCARSGMGAAKLALAQGNQVTIYDQKALELFSVEMQQEIEQLKTMGITFELAPNIDLTAYDLIIMSPGVPMDLPFIEAAQKQGKVIVGELEYASTYCQAPIIAITGTNGKTTTTALVGEILKSVNPDTYVVGNIGRAFSEDVSKIPPSGIAVAEVSSFQLEAIRTFHPKVAALLNITPDHLNRHKTMENYCKAKYDVMCHQNEEDFVILNQNDAYFEEARSLAKAQVILFNGLEPIEKGVYLKGNQLCENLSGTENCLCQVEEMKIVGKHNIENALAAIAICKGYGIANEIIRAGLMAFKGVEHRVEYVTTKKGVDFYNDSKATNTGAAIPGLLSMNKPIRLIAGGMDKKISFKEWIEYFEGRVQKVYVIGEVKEQIKMECKEVGFDAIQLYETFEEAIDSAYNESLEGECVLLSPACASWDMFESYEQRGDIFKHRINQMEG